MTARGLLPWAAGRAGWAQPIRPEPELMSVYEPDLRRCPLSGAAGPEPL